jgi:hypothetical protein
MDDGLAITRSESRVEDLWQLIIVVCLGTEVCCREAVGVEVVIAALLQRYQYCNNRLNLILEAK